MSIGISKTHGPRPLARHGFLHRISTSGETTPIYLFHEVENEASFVKIIIICENNYSSFIFENTGF